MDDILKIILSFFAFGFILYVSYVVSKLIGKKVSVRGGRNIKIIETVPLSSDSLLILIEIFDKLILISKTPKSINILKEFDKNVYKTESDFKDVISNQIYKTKIKEGLDRLKGVFKAKNGGE